LNQLEIQEPSVFFQLKIYIPFYCQVYISDVS
jgi:hypothetical protein